MAGTAVPAGSFSGLYGGYASRRFGRQCVVDESDQQQLWLGWHYAQPSTNCHLTACLNYETMSYDKPTEH